MKKPILFLIIFIIASALVWLLFYLSSSKEPEINLEFEAPLNLDEVKDDKSSLQEDPLVSVVAQNLDVPWSIVVLPTRDILLSERGGTIRLIDRAAGLLEDPVLVIDEVFESGEGGLLGLELHPDFINNNLIYAFYTYRDENQDTKNRVVRFLYSDRKLVNKEILLDALPGNRYHNGGRLKFGPDGYLYITLGDAQNPEGAQDLNFLGGKIIRVDEDGNRAPNNPFNSLIYSYGHRNPQGIAWNDSGELFATEHGRSGVLSGLDEFNLITIGNNYGWPEIEGDEKGGNMISPLIHSGQADTWAPSGMIFYKNSFFFTGLRGEALYRVTQSDNNQYVLEEYFKGEFGRLRDVALAGENSLYLITNNTDGRGSFKEGDDRLIKVNLDKLLSDK